LADETVSPKPRLTREVLVRAALRIADEEGLSALSMRRLGAELGVDPMAAYRHLPNKRALLDGVVEAVLGDAGVETDPSAPWPERFRQVARAYHSAMLAHSPAVMRLAATRPLNTLDSLRIVENALSILLEAGVPADEAVLSIQALGALTCGAVLSESFWREQADHGHPIHLSPAPLPLPELPALSAAVRLFSDPADVFEHGLTAFIEQLESLAEHPESQHPRTAE
jgi:AcrR family transcriptional regulator